MSQALALIQNFLLNILFLNIKLNYFVKKRYCIPNNYAFLLHLVTQVSL